MTPGQKPRVTWNDWVMLLLALISIGLLSWETWGPVTDQQRAQILLADFAICGIFAVEFVLRWRTEGWKHGFLKSNWYEIIGMIPVAHPAFRGFRLFRVIRIVILLSRFGMAADRAFGDEFTYRLVRHFSKGLVQAIRQPIAMAVLDEVSDVLVQGRYTSNISRALYGNRQEVETLLLEKLRADPDIGRLKRLPYFDDLAAAIIRTGWRVTLETLNDPRTDELVADILRENLGQIRESIAKAGEDAAKPAA